MFKAVIFDIDGTLVDSVDLHAQAWQEAFQHYGKDVPFEQVRAQIGKGADQLLPVFFSSDELDRFGDELDALRSTLYQQQYLPKVKAFPRVRELFLRLRQDGADIALASSAQGEELSIYKRLARIDDLVDEETSKDDVDRSKPHPDVFEAALERLGHPTPNSVVVIGDTPYDVAAARRSHLQAIGVLCGGWPAQDLLAVGAVAVFEDPADLLARYELWARRDRPFERPSEPVMTL